MEEEYDDEYYQNLFEKPYQNSYNAGWWKDIETGKDIEITDVVIMQKEVLLMTELAEAVEGDRKELMDDKLPHRKMVEVELADAAIRALDLSYALGITLESAGTGDYLFQENFYDSEELENITFIELVHDTCAILFSPYSHSSKLLQIAYNLILWGDEHGYDVRSAMVEKMHYNKHRADHKLENRVSTGGKKY